MRYKSYTKQEKPMFLAKGWNENLKSQKYIGWHEIFSISVSGNEIKYAVSVSGYRGNGNKPTQPIVPGRCYVWWSGSEWTEEKS